MTALDILSEERGISQDFLEARRRCLLLPGLAGRRHKEASYPDHEEPKGKVHPFKETARPLQRPRCHAASRGIS